AATWGPARRRLRTMGAPMMPRPMTPTRMRPGIRTRPTGRGRDAVRFARRVPSAHPGLDVRGVPFLARPGRDDLRRVHRVRRAADAPPGFPGRVGVEPAGHVRGSPGARGVRARPATA